MLSKSEKNMFYYLGLSLLVLIVLGVLFGVSSVKESFGTSQQNACRDAGLDLAKTLVGRTPGMTWGDKPLRNSIANEIRNKCAIIEGDSKTKAQSAEIGRGFALDVVGSRASAAGAEHVPHLV